MHRPTLAFVCIVSLAPAASLAFQEAESPSTGEVQHLLWLHPARPVFLQIEAYVAQQNGRQRWAEYQRRLFDYLDRDANGKLEGDEAEEALAWWREAPDAALGIQPDGTLQEPFAVLRKALESMADGITRQEWEKALEPVSRQLQCIAQKKPNSEAKSLWDRVDLNSDGLTREELRQLETRLLSLDFDHNELIEPAELTPYRTDINRFFGQQPAMAAADEPLFVSFTPGNVDQQLAQQVLQQYGGPHETLNRENSGLDESVFRRFDRDGSDTLDLDELAALLNDPPCHLALGVQLAPDAAPAQRLLVQDAGGRSAALFQAVTRQPDGSLVIRLEQTRLQLSVSPLTPPDARQQLNKLEFKRADSDGNGYLEKPEVRLQANLRQWFDAIDRDGDGKIFEEEYLVWQRQRTELTESRVQVLTVDHGRVLFDLLDTSTDGQLSRREMLHAADKLSSCDLNADGRLEPGEVPQVIAATIGCGLQQTGQRVPIPGGRPAMGQNTRGGEGPSWFLKMDTNRDGDLSRREFLGTTDQFQQLDSNSDGLINAVEASTATR